MALSAARALAAPRVLDPPRYLRDRLGFLERAAAAANGRPARVWLGTEAYLLTEPADIEHVLVRNRTGYGKTPKVASRRARRLLGRGVLTSVGDEHVEKRRAFAAAFARKSAPSFAPAVARSVEEALERWLPGTEIELAAESMRLARRTVLRVLFGVDAPEVDELDADVAARQRFLHHWIVSLSPRPELMPRRVVREHRAAARRLELAIAAAIAARRDSPRRDLVSLLCAARHTDGTPVTDAEIRDEALTATVTGHETVGTALAWTLFLLATHPLVEQQVLTELAADGVDPSRPETARALERVLLESLRLYPPTWIVVRVALVDDRLPSGLDVHAGRKLYLSQWVTHRDARLFAEPARFDPCRFDEERRAGWPESAYFPFGAGARLCIGKHLALTELAVAVSGLLGRRALTITAGQRIEPEPGLVLAPRYGIRALVGEREPSSSTRPR